MSISSWRITLCFSPNTGDILAWYGHVYEQHVDLPVDIGNVFSNCSQSCLLFDIYICLQNLVLLFSCCKICFCQLWPMALCGPSLFKFGQNHINMNMIWLALKPIFVIVRNSGLQIYTNVYNIYPILLYNIILYYIILCHIILNYILDYVIHYIYIQLDVLQNHLGIRCFPLNIQDVVMTSQRPDFPDRWLHRAGNGTPVFFVSGGSWKLMWNHNDLVGFMVV